MTKQKTGHKRKDCNVGGCGGGSKQENKNDGGIMGLLAPRGEQRAKEKGDKTPAGLGGDALSDVNARAVREASVIKNKSASPGLEHLAFLWPDLHFLLPIIKVCIFYFLKWLRYVCDVLDFD